MVTKTYSVKIRLQKVDLGEVYAQNCRKTSKPLLFQYYKGLITYASPNKCGNKNLCM